MISSPHDLRSYGLEMVRSWISWSHDMTSISTMVINTIITTTMGMETIYPMGCGVVLHDRHHHTYGETIYCMM